MFGIILEARRGQAPQVCDRDFGLEASASQSLLYDTLSAYTGEALSPAQALLRAGGPRTVWKSNYFGNVSSTRVE